MEYGTCDDDLLTEYFRTIKGFQGLWSVNLYWEVYTVWICNFVSGSYKSLYSVVIYNWGLWTKVVTLCLGVSQISGVWHLCQEVFESVFFLTLCVGVSQVSEI